jgi:hypothetical protein
LDRKTHGREGSTGGPTLRQNRRAWRQARVPRRPPVARFGLRRGGGSGGGRGGRRGERRGGGARRPWPSLPRGRRQRAARGRCCRAAAAVPWRVSSSRRPGPRLALRTSRSLTRPGPGSLARV